MPGLIKVDYSMKDPELRAADLNHTGSPHPYVVDYEVLVEEPREVEQTVHGCLRNHREGKEWFRCSTEEAIAAIKSVVGTRVQVENYKRANKVRADEIRHQKEAEERSRRAAEENSQRRESVLDERRQEIIARYELSLKAALPHTNFWAYFSGVFIAIIIALAMFFPDMKDAGFFVLSTIGSVIIAPFIKRYFEEKAKESGRYRHILSKRDAELQAVENERTKVSRSLGKYCMKCRKIFQAERCPTCGG